MLFDSEEDDSLGKDGTLDQKVEGSIKFENVWMEYIKDTLILKGISFDVKKGMNVALVGATGSGKTTTVNLIPKLYPVLKGEVILDGINVKKWKRQAIRRHLGYVGQDVVVFSGTVRENLLGAVAEDRTVSEEMILEACKKTGLDEILSRFGEGLDYHILESGSNLSMGEKQLIAFTRMILKDPSILILDEATANIDEHCERLIQKAVGEVMDGRTCFVIAHRLSTIVDCDMTLVFKDGEIIEQGTHESLMALNGTYAELISHQL
jgi:ABC-type multidrug transport system fused ATPase/permease subunit